MDIDNDKHTLVLSRNQQLMDKQNSSLVITVAYWSYCVSLEIFSLTLGIKVAFLTGENPSLDL